MRVFNPVPPRFTKVARQVVKCAEKVHDQLGPGLLVAAYQSCLALEMDLEELSFQREVSISISYSEIVVHSAMKLDFLVEEAVVVMVLAEEAIKPLHEAQMRTYLKFSDNRVGLIVNFNVVSFKQAVRKTTL